MRPVKPVVPGMNLPVTVMGANQPRYQGLPSFRNIDGVLLSRWKLTFRERLIVLFGGSIYLWTHTFNQPLQPVRLDVERPTRESLGAAASLYRTTYHDERARRDASRTVAKVSLFLILFCAGLSVFASSRLCVESSLDRRVTVPAAAQVSAVRSGSYRTNLRDPESQKSAVAAALEQSRFLRGHQVQTVSDRSPQDSAVSPGATRTKERDDHGGARALIVETGDTSGTLARLRGAVLKLKLDYRWTLYDESPSRLRFSPEVCTGSVAQAALAVAHDHLIFRDSFTFVVTARAVTVYATSEVCSAPIGQEECPKARLPKEQIIRLDKFLASLKSAVRQ